MKHHSQKTGHQHYLLTTATIIVLLIASLLTLHLLYYPRTTATAPKDWQMIICNVGQGSASLLKTQENSAILIDTGPAEGNLKDCLNWAQITSLEAIILSHNHSDHTDNLEEALRASKITPRIFCPKNMGPTCSTEQADSKLTYQHLSQGKILSTKTLTLTTLWPPAETNQPGIDWKNENNHSIIINATLTTPQNTTFTAFIPADAEETALTAALATTTHPTYDLLVVPHHGSNTSGTQFFTTVTATTAAISAGKNNRYGHPHPTILQALEHNNIPVHSTAEKGHMAYRKTAKTLHLTTAN